MALNFLNNAYFAGKVGIGVESPSTKLHIDQPTNDRAGGLFLERNASPYGISMFVNTGGYGIIGSGGSLTVDILSLDLGNGNVGIGTSASSAKLEILDGSDKFRYSSNLTNGFDGIELIGGAPTIKFNQTTSGVDFYQAALGDGTLRVFREGGGTAYLTTLKSNGDFGLSTTTPTQRLHVVGNARVTGAFYASTNSPGTSGQILSSTATGTTWVSGSGLPGGPYLPLAGGTMTGNTLHGDYVKSIYGTGSDLEILHDSSNSLIQTTNSSSGDLYITAGGTNHDLYLNAADDIFIRPQGSQNGIKVLGNDSVELYFNNARRLRTTTEGVFVEGEIKIDSALLDNQENTDVSGSEVVAQVAIATYTAAFFDFVIKKGTNVRSGTVYACHDGTSVQFTETSTQELGDTSDVALSVNISGTQMRLLADAATTAWSVKSLIRAI